MGTSLPNTPNPQDQSILVGLPGLRDPVSSYAYEGLAQGTKNERRPSHQVKVGIPYILPYVHVYQALLIRELNIKTSFSSLNFTQIPTQLDTVISRSLK